MSAPRVRRTDILAAHLQQLTLDRDRLVGELALLASKVAALEARSHAHLDVEARAAAPKEAEPIVLRESPTPRFVPVVLPPPRIGPPRPAVAPSKRHQRRPTLPMNAARLRAALDEAAR